MLYDLILYRTCVMQFDAKNLKTTEPCYHKVDRAMRPIYGYPEKFWESLATPTATFPEIVNGLLL